MLFDTLFTLTTDAVFIDRGGVVIATNAAGAELYGVESPDDLAGKPLVDLVPVEHRQELLDREASVAAGLGRARWNEEAIVTVDGLVKQVRVRSAPIEYEGEPATLVVLRPLLATRHPDQQIRERRLQTFVEASLRLATVAEDDLDTVIEGALRAIAISEGADRAYVVKLTEEPGRVRCSHEWCGPGIEPQIAFLQDLRVSDFPWTSSLLLAGETVHVTDLRLTPAEAEPERQSFGRYGVRSLLQVPMINGGEVVGLVGFNSVHRSVAWPEASIELVRWVGAAMAAALHRRRTSRRLVEAQRQAVAASEAKSTFLSRTSHELRTPLNAVLGFTELMLLDADRSDRDLAHLRQIQTSSVHLLGIVEDLLDLGSVESGRLSISLEQVCTIEVIEAALAMVKSAHLDTGLDLRWERPLGEPVAVMADRQRLQQVIVNLASNACKYNRQGGAVDVRLYAADHEWAIIEVVDTGIGIPEHLQHRVFQPFDRLGQEDTSTPGTGIGLALTKHLVEAMDGELMLTSVEGVGTTVTVRLPLTHARGLCELGPPAPAVRSAVVVENNEASALVICHVLRGLAGIEPTLARTAAEGLALIEDALPDLVILDYHLPDETGEQVLRRLRDEPRTREVPVMFVTAAADPGIAQRLTAMGAARVVVKPAGVAELLAAVEQTLFPSPRTDEVFAGTAAARRSTLPEEASATEPVRPASAPVMMQTDATD